MSVYTCNVCKQNRARKSFILKEISYASLETLQHVGLYIDRVCKILMPLRQVIPINELHDYFIYIYSILWNLGLTLQKIIVFE